MDNSPWPLVMLIIAGLLMTGVVCTIVYRLTKEHRHYRQTLELFDQTAAMTLRDKFLLSSGRSSSLESVIDAYELPPI